MTDVVDLIDYVPKLRLHLGDKDSTLWEDAWLKSALIASIETLERWWNYKYLLDSNDDVYRNTSVNTFLFGSPPVIEDGDVRPIILMAGLIIKTGDLESRAWNIGSWRDAEIQYSNIEASRSRDRTLTRDWNELIEILKPPQKVLAHAKKTHLPGYRYNPLERKGIN